MSGEVSPSGLVLESESRHPGSSRLVHSQSPNHFPGPATGLGNVLDRVALLPACLGCITRFSSRPVHISWFATVRQPGCVVGPHARAVAHPEVSSIGPGERRETRWSPTSNRGPPHSPLSSPSTTHSCDETQQARYLRSEFPLFVTSETHPGGCGCRESASVDPGCRVRQAAQPAHPQPAA